MAPTLYRGSRPGAGGRARDWAEIQERMLVPLYETVYDRLEVGCGTRLLGLGCGSGLALLLAAHRGAHVTGCDRDEQRLALARARLRPDAGWEGPGAGRYAPRRRAALVAGLPGRGGVSARDADVVTAFDPAEPAAVLRPALDAVAATAPRGSAVVLAGWGPPERCSAARVLRIATRLAAPDRAGGAGVPQARLSGRDDLEELAEGVGLRPDGSGRVPCPFGYGDLDSAVRGLLSTGLFDAAVAAAGREQVDKEIAEALHPYRRADGTVRMDNVFRYLIARV